MGRPYTLEIGSTESAYKSAFKMDITDLVQSLEHAKDLPMTAIGSGGALTTAIFASLLHQGTGMMSQFSTPLEAVSSSFNFRKSAVLMVSGRGQNRDILESARVLIRREPKEGIVLCATKGSRLAILARKFGWDVVDFNPPGGREGFLAVNSIMASATLLTRAYADLLDSRNEFPVSLDAVARVAEDFSGVPDPELRPALARETFVVLYGKWGKPAAFDLESKCSEAALTNVMLADYRNFAHGRHYWLAKRADKSTIITYVTPDEESIARRTLDLLPKEIPRIIVSSKEGGPIAGLGFLKQTMKLVERIGNAHDLDPGWPAVPAFGRRIYNLIPGYLANERSSLLGMGWTAVSRKLDTRSEISNLRVAHSLRDGLGRFVESLEGAEFSGIVFDYDGTLCEPEERFEGVSTSVSGLIQHLLLAEISMGIATGRGRSVRDSLRKVAKRDQWKQILVGYYNGSDIGGLEDDSHPKREGPTDSSLGAIAKRLANDRRIRESVNVESRPKQISLQPRHPMSLSELQPIVQELLAKHNPKGVRMVTSAHSIDLLAPGVSKLQIVAAMQERLPQKLPILCIGDSGRWPGNDYELLSGPYSLSVDAVSGDPDSCWNLAPPGFRGTRALETYLHAIEAKKGVFRFKYAKLRSRYA